MKDQQKTSSRSKPRRQIAALPVRFDAVSGMQVLLLTTRTTRRWIIPKGWPMRKISAAAAAAREAYEEAGIEGVFESDTPIGRYRTVKVLDDGRKAEIEVEVFLLRVTRQLESWPEQAERCTRWCDPQEAASLVEEPGLAALLLQAGRSTGSHG